MAPLALLVALASEVRVGPNRWAAAGAAAQRPSMQATQAAAAAG